MWKDLSVHADRFKLDMINSETAQSSNSSFWDMRKKMFIIIGEYFAKVGHYQLYKQFSCSASAKNEN